MVGRHPLGGELLQCPSPLDPTGRQKGVVAQAWEGKGGRSRGTRGEGQVGRHKVVRHTRGEQLGVGR